jgi:hypothetical protein
MKPADRPPRGFSSNGMRSKSAVISLSLSFPVPRNARMAKVSFSAKKPRHGGIVDEAIPDGRGDSKARLAQDALEFSFIRAVFPVAGIREHGRVCRPGSVGIIQARGRLKRRPFKICVICARRRAIKIVRFRVEALYFFGFYLVIPTWLINQAYSKACSFRRS